MIIHGVDFSGAESGGATKIRVVERNTRDRSAPLVFRGRCDRNGLLRMIRESVSDNREHTWRIDAPFGLPIEIIDAFSLPHDWTKVATWMRDFGSPRGWRHEVRNVSRKEPKRVCDREDRTPMAPINLRVFKQTWTLISEVLLPLAEDGVRIEPMLHRNPDAKVVVCEGCPASILLRYGWPSKGYKGDGDPPKEVRAMIASRLRSVGVFALEALAGEAIEDTEGDLLDAMILTSPPVHTVPPKEAMVEGWIF